MKYLALPIQYIKPPVRKTLSLYRQCLDTWEDIRFLMATKAPYESIISNLANSIKSSSQLKPYLTVQKKFRSQQAGLSLSNDWFSKYIPQWLAVFENYAFKDKATINALEIGSWEGLSSYFLLHSLPNAILTCVDTWEGADEHQSGDAVSLDTLNQIETAFDSNLNIFQDRLRKFKGTSFSFFNQNTQRNTFDFIYVDGSHHSDDVMIDAIKCFEQLKVGGIMIFDDYLWQYYPKAIDNPAGAINAFLKLKKGSYKIVRSYYQLIIEKTSDRYA